ncbi:MAG: SIMPL domain-containing protein [Candidatus Paceibacterota bacterium]|jgi:hypothetical protein
MEEIKNRINPATINGLVGVATLLLLALVVSTTMGIFDKIGETENVISVSGTGEIYAAPDLAQTYFSVVTESETVAEALSENTEKMNAVTAAVKAQGVEDKDMKTTTFNISPRYEWDKEKSSYYYPEGERVLVGYEVTQTLEVKIRNLANTANVLEAGADAGSNQVGSLTFTIEDADGLRNQAREMAINEAKEKAEVLADQLGIKLLGIASFSENGGYYYSKSYDSDAAMGAASESLEISTGENKVEVSVSITYKVK